MLKGAGAGGDACHFYLEGGTGLAQVSDDIDIVTQSAKQVCHHPGQTIIVTLGAKGIVFINQDEIIRINGIAVDAVDTTGAGDCFAGAFAVALSEQMALENALVFVLAGNAGARFRRSGFGY